MKKYKVKWKFNEPEFGNFTKQQVIDDDCCGCDAFLYVSILEHEDGSTSTMVTGRDGRTNDGQISDSEIFKAWLSIAHRLKDSKHVHDWQRNLCETVILSVRELLLGPTV